MMRFLLAGLAAVLVVPFGHVVKCIPVSMEYMGHTYHYFPLPESFNTAIAKCESVNSHLVFLETMAEANEIHDWVKTKGISPYWIGLIRKSGSVRLPWVWSSSISEPISGQDLAFDKFNENEMVLGNKNRACVDGEFWIADEETAIKPYVCEDGDQPVDTTTDILAEANTEVDNGVTTNVPTITNVNVDKTTRHKTVYIRTKDCAYITAEAFVQKRCAAVTMCSRLCTSNIPCVRYNYNTVTGECRLFNNHDHILEDHSDWTVWDKLV